MRTQASAIMVRGMKKKKVTGKLPTGIVGNLKDAGGKISHKQLVKALVALSLVPFLLFSLVPLMGATVLPSALQDQLLLVVYSASVLAFIGGTFWHKSLQLECRWLSAFSAIPLIAPLGIICIIFYQPVPSWVVFGWMALIFVLCLGMDWQLLKRGELENWLFSLRIIKTAIVLVSLLLASLAPVLNS